MTSHENRRKACFLALGLGLSAACSSRRHEVPVESAPRAVREPAGPLHSTAVLRTLREPAGVRAVPLERAARVEMPARADERARIEDPATGLSVAFRLVGARGTPGADVDGVRAFAGGGPSGSGVFMRSIVSGVEDFVAFDRRPEHEWLRYAVDVSRVAGLRLIGNVLEFLDSGGAPRLRMNAPRFADERGAENDARVVLEDCAADRNPSAPWGRPVTPPGRADCVVRVEWAGARPQPSYPLLVDPAWTAATNAMTAARAGHTATRLANGKVLVVGGQHPNGAAAAYLNSTELFDPATNTFAAADTLAGPRAFHVAVALSNGDVLVAGGADAAGAVETAERYVAATQKFTSAGALKAARQSAAAVDLGNGKVLVTGGVAGGLVLQTAELFDTSATTWTFTRGNLQNARFGHYVAMVPSGQAVVVGGASLTAGTLVPPSSEYYSSGADGFTSAPGLATGRHHFGAAILSDSRILVAGGSTAAGTETASAEVFDPNLGAWSPAGTLAHARAHCVLSVLSNEAAVVTGGTATAAGTKTFLRSAELFDPSAKKWIPLPDMQQPRADHTATVLSDGRVLVTGGSTSQTAVSATAELLSLDKNGAPCATGLTCQSKECVDGVCCETACTSACFACATTATGMADGTCGPVLAGKDPGGSCKDDGAPACGQNGLCDGSGGCAKYPAKPCTPSPCTAGTDCTSGNCADGICCDAPCSGTCEACTAAKKEAGGDGACGPVAAGTDPDSECGSMGTGSCKGDATCDGSGACKVPNAGKSCAAVKCADSVTLSEAAACTASGDCTPQTKSCVPYRCDATASACKTSCATDADCAPGGTCASGACHLKDDGQSCAADAECTSGHCVDGFCCDTACAGQCAACDVSGSEGKCSPVTGAPHGSRTACNGSAPCGGACNGRLTDSCSYPSGNSCGSNVGCADGSVTAEKCNGFGDCANIPGASCAPFACAAEGCKTSCKTDADCAFGYTCDPKTGCELRGTSPCADGGGGKDCASAPAAPGDDGGCGCRVTGRVSSARDRGSVAALLLGGAAWRRRNKRKMLGRSARRAGGKDDG